MSCVGLSCVILLSSGQLRVAIIRASSQALYPDSDLSTIRVLLEWCDAEYHEWVTLNDLETFHAVFLEKTLLWARRVLPSEMQRAVAWPAKAFTMLCGIINFPPDAMIVEYSCDKEKTQLYMQETKELLLSEARSTLSQHPMMLQELSEWEEQQRSRELLNSAHINLTGRRVLVYNIQNAANWISGTVSAHNQQTKALTLVEDHTQSVQTVDPLMVHVLIQPSGEEMPYQGSSWSHPPPLSLTNSPDISIGNGSPATPHLTSPVIQECQSPNLFGQSKSFHRTSSMDLLKRTPFNYSQRRSSLQHLNTSPLTYEPGLHRRSSLDPLTLGKYQSGLLDHTPLDGHSQSLVTLNRLHLPLSSGRPRVGSSSLIDVHTPYGSTILSRQGSATQLSNHGSTTQLSTHGSNTSINEPTPLHSFPTFPSPDEFPFNERSKSLGNIFTSLGQRPLQHASSYPTADSSPGYFSPGARAGQKRGLGSLARGAVKKPRFEVLPTISADPCEGNGESSKIGQLSRSFSQPAIFAPKRSQTARPKSINKHEDDLDIIHQIIETDETTLPQDSAGHMHDSQGRSLSLSHLNNFSSLPTIPSDESMHHVLKANYFSAPDFSRLESPPSYENSLGLKQEHCSRPLTHESRSSSLGDFQLCDRVSDHTASPILGSHRNSVSYSNGLSNSLSHSLGDVHEQPGYNASGIPYDMMTQNSLDHSCMHHCTSTEDVSREHPVFEENDLHMKMSSVAPNKRRLESILNLRLDGHSNHNGRFSVSGTFDMNTSSGFMSSKNGSIPAFENSTAHHLTPGTGARGSWSGELGPGASIAGDPEILSPVMTNDGEELESIEEFSIARVINQHIGTGDIDDPSGLLPSDLVLSPGSSVASNSSGDKNKSKSKTNKKENSEKRNPRGRPRLTEEEKQRRKELRELGLMKRSRRRTKEEVEQWRAEKTLTPVKRGRKPGSGKKNIVKTITGKPVFVNLDMRKYQNGTILLQNGFCRAFPGVSKCLDCGNCEGELPVSRYCRFLEFRKLVITDNSKQLVTVKGFADYTDVSAEDLVPWTPLKASFSSMDETTALFLLRSITEHFISIATEQARTLPDIEGTLIPAWRRPVQGIRELCDMCATSLFNFHWVCPHCGFCVCPACYRAAEESENDSQSNVCWPNCTATSSLHNPRGLILAQIIPANVLAEVLVQALWLCEAQKIQVNASPLLVKLVTSLATQEPQTKFKNESNKKSKAPLVHLKSPLQQLPPQLISNNPTSAHHSDSVTLPHPLTTPTHHHPHAVQATHQWLCSGRLLLLRDPTHPDNLTAFQEAWASGQAVIVSGVHNRLSRELWTPESFERDFGEESADLVDCQNGALLQMPCRVFWSGFSQSNLRLIDPATNEARLLKLKDWPTCDDFGEKLPKRYQDLMDALPLQEYTRREGKYNMASSLPSFFVKPDLGPKMYCAYGSPLKSSFGTTNLHIDISSAVNVMVYSSVPVQMEGQTRKLISEIVTTECCSETVKRLTETGAEVGAIWHVYPASEADKLRSFLKRINEERSVHVTPTSDPIHDQLMYLDSDLRERLYREEGVRGWAIAQCPGDAIFIPAGAPHQVRNVRDSIKVALDFVSPEQIGECLKLTEEFRRLSEKHINREDKLQTQNIIYHSMKDVVGALKSYTK